MVAVAVVVVVVVVVAVAVVVAVVVVVVVAVAVVLEAAVKAAVVPRIADIGSRIEDGRAMAATRQ